MYNLSVSPDFAPEYIAGWYVFNTWLQRQLKQAIHLELYNDFAAQRKAIAADKIDIIYANPFDASMLVREKGFKALAKPINKADEAIIATASSTTIEKIEDLKPGTRIVMTDDPDVNLIGNIMLEPADLDDQNTKKSSVATYVLVAKMLLQEKADIGFFLKDAYMHLSSFIQKNLRVLVSSEIGVIQHSLLLSPKALPILEDLQRALLQMHNTPAGSAILKDLDIQAWEIQNQEDTEFMIDLIDTLID